MPYFAGGAATVAPGVYLLLNTPTTVYLLALAVIDKRKMKKHFALDIADGRFTYRRRDDEIAAEARLDGIYAIRTIANLGTR